MEPIDLNLDEAKFPNVTGLYGTNPVDLARDMDRAQSLGDKDREPTRTDLISCMINLEDDLEHERLMNRVPEFDETDTKQDRMSMIANAKHWCDAKEVGVYEGYEVWEFSGSVYDGRFPLRGLHPLCAGERGRGVSE